MQSDLFFDAEEYWRGKPYKKYVVRLYGRGKKPNSRTYNIAARTPERAVKAAQAYCHIKGLTQSSVRLATPWDLGCTIAKTA